MKKKQKSRQFQFVNHSGDQHIQFAALTSLRVKAYTHLHHITPVALFFWRGGKEKKLWGKKTKQEGRRKGAPKEVTLKSCLLLTASCQSCSLRAIGGVDPFSIIFLYALCSKHDSRYLKLIFQPHGQYLILEIQLTPMNSLCKPQPPSVPALFFV